MLAHLVGNDFDLSVIEAVRLQRVNDAVDIAKVVIEKRALNTAGQSRPDVADLLAHRVPDIGHFTRLGIVLELHDDLRLARLGVAADLVGVRHLLQTAFELGGDLLGHLLRGGTRPHRAHHHGPEGEWRVFVLTQLKIGEATHHHQHNHQVARQRAVVQCPAGQVETAGSLWRGGGRGVATRFVFHAGLTSQQGLERRRPAQQQVRMPRRLAAGTA